MVDYAIDVFKKLHPDQEVPQVSFNCVHSDLVAIVNSNTQGVL